MIQLSRPAHQLLQLLLLLAASAVTTADGTDDIGKLQICAQTCVTFEFQQCHCPLGDFGCFCSCNGVLPTLQQCSTTRCSIDMNQTIDQFLDIICPTPTTSSSSIITTTSTSSSSSSKSIDFHRGPTTTPCAYAHYNISKPTNGSNSSGPGCVVIAGATQWDVPQVSILVLNGIIMVGLGVVGPLLWL
ncbi:hypothetical protein B0H66DRAFT_641775 [Apodospora peruviana]|uniref:CFEM domain-containing protein n=1 Tax=Apodospora peruviana TaxID=516989 RepID=A0AAE0M3Z6_9PEZI|nr:hypothetical protein B0H66DRAFT_641775 [Apodospora peruviana]